MNISKSEFIRIGKKGFDMVNAGDMLCRFIETTSGMYAMYLTGRKGWYWGRRHYEMKIVKVG